MNGFWCFLWFVGFCYTTDRYKSLDPTIRDAIPIISTICLRATIAFSFFSIILWVRETGREREMEGGRERKRGREGGKERERERRD